ncbi:MAG: hypothetical protein C9356_20100 [Oleiphilus sp.]|nr:MAG: hypothetical protein C9356_20100 [Oleiphilus sp.]
MSNKLKILDFLCGLVALVAGVVIFLNKQIWIYELVGAKPADDPDNIFLIFWAGICLSPFILVRLTFEAIKLHRSQGENEINA